MRSGLWTSVAALLASAGLASAQSGLPAQPGSDFQSPQLGSPSASGPALMAGAPQSEAPKEAGCLPPTELPSAPLDPGFGVWVPNGPNAFDPPKPNKPSLRDLGGSGQIWAGAEYLLWWVKQAPIDGPLVTSGTPASQGILNMPGTTVLFGDKSIDYGPLSGGKFTIGFSNPDHNWGIEASAFVLETGRKTFETASDAAGNPVIARPFINALNTMEDRSLVSFPGALAGSIKVTSSTDLVGAEVNLLHGLESGSGGPCFDVIVGFRYLSLEESLTIAQQTTVLTGGILGFNGEPALPPDIVGVSDNFHTRNDFYGGQIGAQMEFNQGRLFIFVSGKLGIGNTHQLVNAAGQTTITDPVTGTRSTPGGLFAVSTNSGITSQNEFTLVPEGIIHVGYEVTKNLRLFAGYTFLYWDDVVRPGEQFTRVVNTSFVPSSLNFGTGLGSPVTSVAGNHTDFWAQGVNIGCAFRY
jgi:hypothetical protein